MMSIIQGQIFWSWNHFRATYWFLAGSKVRQSALIMQVTGELKKKEKETARWRNSVNMSTFPTSHGDLWSRKGTALCYLGHVSVRIPLLIAKCLRLAKETGFEGSWTCQTAFLVGNCAGASNARWGSCCSVPLSKRCPHWVHSHLEQNHSSVSPNDSLTPSGKPCWVQVNQKSPLKKLQRRQGCILQLIA